jgi:hypothetical protein
MSVSRPAFGVPFGLLPVTFSWISEVPSKLPMATHLSIHTLNLSCPHFLNGSLTQLIAQAKVLKVVIDFYHFYLLSLSCQHTLTFPSLNYS